MTTELVGDTQHSDYIAQMRAARDGSAVLKIALVSLRSEFPEIPILVFEGPDDKIVYNQWIRRIRPGLSYEAFVCKGKRGLRSLKNMVSRDKADLACGLYFFVDRDFDDLIGFADGDNVFMIDTYSVENYLVSREVVAEVLRDEFPCHGLPKIREAVCDIFDRDYEQFILVTREINWRLYVARRTPIPLSTRITSSLSGIAGIAIGTVRATAVQARDVIGLVREPTPEEEQRCAADFDTFDPRKRYRGKFAFKFFREWLDKLADEFRDQKLGIFQGCDEALQARRSEFVLSNFAGKSQLPNGLPDFVNAIAA